MRPYDQAQEYLRQLHAQEITFAAFDRRTSEVAIAAQGPDGLRYSLAWYVISLN